MIRSKEDKLNENLHKFGDSFYKSLSDLAEFYLEGNNLEEMALEIMMKQLNINSGENNWFLKSFIHFIWNT